jgi:hypothetical protein
MLSEKLTASQINFGCHFRPGERNFQPLIIVLTTLVIWENKANL